MVVIAPAPEFHPELVALGLARESDSLQYYRTECGNEVVIVNKERVHLNGGAGWEYHWDMNPDGSLSPMNDEPSYGSVDELLEQIDLN